MRYSADAMGSLPMAMTLIVRVDKPVAEMWVGVKNRGCADTSYTMRCAEDDKS